MNFINNLNIIQHHNNEIHKHLTELYKHIEERAKQLHDKEQDVEKREAALQSQLEDIENYNRVSIITSQDKQIVHLERKVSQLHNKLKKKRKGKQSKKIKKT